MYNNTKEKKMTRTAEILIKLDKSVDMEINRREHLRLGQTYFNILCEMEPEIAAIIRGTENDPFYDDKKINDFKKKIVELLVRKYG
jgi:hypothetical protein